MPVGRGDCTRGVARWFIDLCSVPGAESTWLLQPANPGDPLTHPPRIAGPTRRVKLRKPGPECDTILRSQLADSILDLLNAAHSGFSCKLLKGWLRSLQDLFQQIESAGHDHVAVSCLPAAIMSAASTSMLRAIPSQITVAAWISNSSCCRQREQLPRAFATAVQTELMRAGGGMSRSHCSLYPRVLRFDVPVHLCPARARVSFAKPR